VVTYYDLPGYGRKFADLPIPMKTVSNTFASVREISSDYEAPHLAIAIYLRKGINI